MIRTCRRDILARWRGTRGNAVQESEKLTGVQAQLASARSARARSHRHHRAARTGAARQRHRLRSADSLCKMEWAIESCYASCVNRCHAWNRYADGGVLQEAELWQAQGSSSGPQRQPAASRPAVAGAAGLPGVSRALAATAPATAERAAHIGALALVPPTVNQPFWPW